MNELTRPTGRPRATIAAAPTDRLAAESKPAETCNGLFSKTDVREETMPAATARFRKRLVEFVGRFTRLWSLFCHCRVIIRPGSGGARMALGHALMRRGRHKSASGSYRKAIALLPSEAQAHWALGRSLEKQDRNDEAEASYHAALALRPEWAEAHLSLGSVQSRLGKNAEALASFHTALALRPDWDEAHASLGHLLSEQGKDTEATACFRRALELRPGWAEIHLRLAYLLDRQGHNQEAIGSYRTALTLRPDWADVYKSLGHVWNRLREFEQAEASFRQAIALQPESAEAQLALGQTLARQGILTEGIEHIREAVRLRSNWKEALLSLADNLVRIRQHAEAGAVCAALIDREPFNVELCMWVAHKYMVMGDFDRAVARFNQAASLEPDRVEAHVGLIEAHSRSGNLEAAVQCCRRACDLNPVSVEAQLRIGAQLQWINQSQEGLIHFDRAIALAPERIDSYTDIWSVLTASAQFDEAGRYYRRNREVQRAAALHYPEDAGTRYLTSLWTCQIGHLAHIDSYLKTEQLGLRPAQRTVVVPRLDAIANRYYLDCWRRYLEVNSDPRFLEVELSRIQCREDYLSMNSLETEGIDLWAPIAAATIQKRWEAEGRGPLLKLPDADIERGRRCLQKLGVPVDAWFVGLHVREPGFHYHDGSQQFRDASTASYLQAIETITRRGGWVIRMGDPTMSPMPRMERVIDYAHSDVRSDWMDIFLCAGCRFMIGTQSGLSLVPATFGVPCAMTNWTSLGTPPWYGHDLFLPKLFYSGKHQRHLTFAEVFDSSLAFSQRTVTFALEKVRLIDNAPEDINDLVIEMLERCEGSVRYTAEDENLWGQFVELASAHRVIVAARMGRAFLRKHAALLPGF